MKINFYLSQFVDFKQILEEAIAELEYYAVYDPDVINCAIAFAISKPIEIALTYGIENLSASSQNDLEAVQQAKN